jgi:uncharacterized protein YcbK (DUF882 family)
MIQTYKKGSSEWIGQNWQAKDFDCQCSHCSETKVDEDLVHLLDSLVLVLNFKPVLTSAYRCDDHQAELKAQGYPTAAGRSVHQDGKAVDLRGGGLPGRKLEEIARKVGFKSVGVAKGWIHVDTRPAERSWKY